MHITDIKIHLYLFESNHALNIKFNSSESKSLAFKPALIASSRWNSSDNYLI